MQNFFPSSVSVTWIFLSSLPVKVLINPSALSIPSNETSPKFLSFLGFPMILSLYLATAFPMVVCSSIDKGSSESTGFGNPVEIFFSLFRFSLFSSFW